MQRVWLHYGGKPLLAQNVLLGNTEGYKNHPQLKRFNNTGNPVGAIAGYLRSIADEADRRGYYFNRSKIVNKKIKMQNTCHKRAGRIRIQASAREAEQKKSRFI